MPCKKTPPVKIRTRDLCVLYRGRQVLHSINVELPANMMTAITGPSGSGKSTFLMVLNRLWEELDTCSIKGVVEMEINGRMRDIHAPSIDTHLIRQRVGMVFQQPNPLPMSIYKNMAFPLHLVHVRDRNRIEAAVETALRQAHLWEEVRDRLHEDARTLSGGQQQRLCLARALMLKPEVLLLDEPTASLDPEASEAIEELLIELKQTCTLIMVSHYHDQINRTADLHFEVRNGQFKRMPTEEMNKGGVPKNRSHHHHDTANAAGHKQEKHQ